MKKISLLIGVAALAALPAVFFWCGAATGADIIYFKDGMRTLCHGKAWAEKDEVHCEHDGGLLIYPKNDVAQIEHGPSVKADPAPGKGRDTGEKTTPSPAAAPAPPSKAESPPSAQPPSGVLFYDPRRDKKYWSSPTGRHDSYQEALSALAFEFGRPVQWIEEKMGDSNDLGEIRGVLSSNKQAASPAPAVPANHSAAGGIEFYNPRRPQRYWTAPDARHNTYEEAIEALSREFGKPPVWVERHLGDANDIDLIRRDLRNAQSTEEGN
jgi:hypothetical protein